MRDDQNKGPVDTLRDGNIKATIWERKSEKGPFYSTSFARTYEDAGGQLCDTDSFSGTDVLKVSELGRRAYDRTNELRREQSQSREEFQTKRKSQNSPEKKHDQRNH